MSDPFAPVGPVEHAAAKDRIASLEAQLESIRSQIEQRLDWHRSHQCYQNGDSECEAILRLFPPRPGRTK